VKAKGFFKLLGRTDKNKNMSSDNQRALQKVTVEKAWWAWQNGLSFIYYAVVSNGSAIRR
jgi:hypothetical protein